MKTQAQLVPTGTTLPDGVALFLRLDHGSCILILENLLERRAAPPKWRKNNGRRSKDSKDVK